LTWARWQDIQGLPIKYQNMFKPCSYSLQ